MARRKATLSYVKIAAAAATRTTIVVRRATRTTFQRIGIRPKRLVAPGFFRSPPRENR
jgi:hypothetical protein